MQTKNLKQTHFQLLIAVIMKASRVVKFIVLIICIIGCEPPSKDIWALEDSNCSLWWLYDEGISDGPTPLFICFNKKKYYTYSITKHGNLRKPLIGDVVYSLTEHGRWEIKSDSLYLQDKNFSAIIKVSDTVYLRPNSFLIDATDKFNIENCDCDNIIAQFKGGNIDSIKTLLNYKE